MNDMDKFFIQAAFKSLDEIDSEENKPIKKALLESRKREKLKRCAGNPELNAKAFNHAADVGASSPSTGLGEDYNSEGAAIEKKSEESIEGYKRRLKYACEDFSADGGSGLVAAENRLAKKLGRAYHKRRGVVGEDYDPKHNRYNLKDPDDVEKAKRVHEESDDGSDLVIIHPAYSHKKPRPGNAIISCKACEEVFYLDKSELEQSEDDPELYNADMRCENCGAEDGYDYIGDVTEADTPSAEEAISERESDAGEFAEPEEEPEEETEEEPQEEYEEEEEEPEELVEESFDRLINKYAKSVYENFESYRTTSISQTGKGEYLVEGYILSWKGGKRKDVSFTLTEAYKRNGHTFYNCQNKGLIETTAQSPLRFSTKQEDKKLIFESLRYRYPQEVDGKKYLVEGVQIHG